jgi:hypothetical protein
MRRVLFAVSLIIVLVLVAWLATGCPVNYGALAGAAEAPDSSPSSRYTATRVTITTTTGRRLTCLLRAPSSRALTLILAGGQVTGRRAVLKVDSTVAALALACDYPWRELADRRGLAFLLALPKLRAEIVATPQVLGIAATYLLARPEADSARFAAVGASLGVPPVAAWAGTDPRPRAVALLYGGGELWRLFEANLGGDVRSPRLRSIVARVLGFLLRPIEPTRTVGGVAPRPLLVVGAEADRRIPRRGIEALFAAAGEPKRLVWFGGQHMDVDDAAILRVLADTTLTWLDGALRGPAR